jgi:RecA-family ATPase
VFIDGVGDLAADPNDTAEAFELVQELHTLAITHECVIITVLHENPGSETGKTRGHLGSQIERKAETNLRLAKDKDGVTTMWAEKARHCYLPKEQGPCFSWNDQEQMHTSCGTAGEIKTAANRAKMEEEAELAFDGEGLIRHTELMAAIGKALDLKEGAQKTRIKKWAAEGVIQKDKSGNYRLANP